MVVAEQWKKGHKHMPSIFDGIGSYYLMGIPFLYFTLPFVTLMQPLMVMALTLTLILTGFACAYVAMSIPKKNSEMATALLIAFFITFYSAWVGLLIGLFVAFQFDIDSYLNLPKDLSVVAIVGSVGAFLSIFMWSLNPLSDFQCSTDRTRNYVSRVVDTTNFVSTWVICGFLVFEVFMFFTSIDLKDLFSTWLPFVPLIAILFGFLPGCGPQIVVTTFYLNGYIPLSAEMGNAISNDGDALFPAIALAPKAAIIATLYSAIPAIIVAYGYMYLFE